MRIVSNLELSKELLDNLILLQNFAFQFRNHINRFLQNLLLLLYSHISFAFFLHSLEYVGLLMILFLVTLEVTEISLKHFSLNLQSLRLLIELIHLLLNLSQNIFLN